MKAEGKSWLRRNWMWVALLSMLLAAAVIGGRPAPADMGPNGTAAARRYLRNMGLQVAQSPELPPGGTVILLSDLRDGRDAVDLMGWVEAGGHLVIAGPSDAAFLMGVAPVGAVGTVGDVNLKAGCLRPETAGLKPLVVEARESLLASETPESTGCFVSPTGAFAIFLERGRGSAVILGGSTPFRNQRLDRGGNADFLYRISAPGPVVFGPPVVPGPGEQVSIWEALPFPVKALLIQLVLAAILFALVNARRLGPVLQEDPMSPIPAGQLVGAVARLYRGGRQLDYAASAMRKEAVERLSARLGIPRGDPKSLVRAVAARTDKSETEVGKTLLRANPKDDEELIAHARELESLNREVEEAKS